MALVRWRTRKPGRSLTVLLACGGLIGLAAVWVLRARSDPAEAAYRAGQYRDSLTLANERLRTRRDDRPALRLSARSSARLGRDPTALALFGRLGSDDAEAEDMLLLAGLVLRQGKVADAAALYENALKLDPNHGETLDAYARFLARGDRLAEAVPLARRLARVKGWEAQGLALLGRTLDRQADTTGAAPALAAALHALPNPPPPDLSAQGLSKDLARALLKLGRPDEVPTLLRPFGADPEAHWLVSRAWLQKGDRPAALTAHRTGSPPGAGPAGFDKAEPAPFVGSARCADCHRELYEAQQASRHARTFEKGGDLKALGLPAAEFPEAAGPPGTALRVESGPARLRATVGGEVVEAVIDYVLGSGRHARTPVGRDASGTVRELRLTYYHEVAAWDLTPGQPVRPRDERDYLGVAQTDDSLRRCVGCHTTNPRAVLTGQGPEAADRGVGCERCHGPGGNHVTAVGLAFPDLAIGRFPKSSQGSRPQVLRLCGSCHGTEGREVLQDSPAATVRFQATTLTWSPCFEKSGGALDCLTCHSPHHDDDRSVPAYESKCLACHGGSPAGPGAGANPACPVNPHSGCLDCHMPKVPSVVPHTRFTDHHIRVRREEGVSGARAGSPAAPR